MKSIYHQLLSFYNYKMVHIIAWAMLFFVTACATSKKSLIDEQSKLVHLTLLGINDVHGAIEESAVKAQGKSIKAGGFAALKAYVDAAREANPNTFLFAAGDLFQGTPLSNMFLGQSIIPAYNKLKITAATMGNHELDYGQLAYKSILHSINFPFLIGNIREKKSPDSLPFFNAGNILPYKIIKVEGISVGIMALTTLSTPEDTGPTNSAGLEFINYETSAKNSLSSLRKEGAEVILLLVHDGGVCDMSKSPEEGDAACINTDPVSKLLEKLPKGSIHAVIAGHIHSPQAHFIQGVPVIQNKDTARSMGRIDLWLRRDFLGLKKGEAQVVVKAEVFRPQFLCHQVFKNYNSCDEKELSTMKSDLGEIIPARYEGKSIVIDNSIMIEADHYKKQIAPILNKVAAILPKTLVNERSKESYAGNCAADVEKIGFEKLTGKKVDVFYVNSGKIRANFPEGTLRYEDIYIVMPFEFKTILAELTGAELNQLAFKYNVRPKDISIVSEGWQILLKPNFPKHAGLRRPNGQILKNGEKIKVLLADQYLEVFPEIFEQALKEKRIFFYDKLTRDVLFEGFKASSKNLPRSCTMSEDLKRNYFL